jgi:hypothetical protein
MVYRKANHFSGGASIKNEFCYFLSSRFHDRVIAKVIAHPCIEIVSIERTEYWFRLLDCDLRHVSIPLRCPRLTATFNLLCGWIACWFAREPFVVSWCHYCAASHYDANRFALIAAKRAKVEMKIASKGMSDAGRQRNNVGAAPLSPRFKDRRRDPRDAALRDDSGWRNACIRGVPAHACDALILFRTGSFPENARA